MTHTNGNADAATEQTPLLQAPLVKEPPKKSDLWLVLTSLWIGVFLAALDGTVVATMLSTIGSDFKATNLVSWLGTSFFVSNSGFQALYGRFSDIFGRKAALLFAAIVFLIGTIGCAVAQDMPQIIVARAIAGIGGGGLTTMSSVITSDLVSLKDRGLYQGFGNIVYATASAAGGPLGGLFADTIGWRWGFGLQIPFCLLSIVGVMWKVNIPLPMEGNLKTRLGRIDWFGAASLVIGVSAFIIGMSLGGNELPWESPFVWGPLIGSVVMIVSFVLVEKYVASDPVMPLRVVITRTPAATAAANFCSSMAAFSVIYGIPQFFTIVLGTSASRAGLHLIPQVIPMAVGSVGSGWYMRKTGKYYWFTIACGALICVGPLLVATWPMAVKVNKMGEVIQGGEGQLWTHWVFSGPMGFGTGAMLTTTLVALIASVAPNDVATATGMSYLFRATGSVVGISVTSALLQNIVKRLMAETIPDLDLIDEIRKSPTAIIPHLPPLYKQAARQAYAQGFTVVFLTAAGFGLLCWISAAFIQEHPLPGTLDRTNETDNDRNPRPSDHEHVS